MPQPAPSFSDLTSLVEGLPSDFLTTDPDILTRHSRDWSGDHAAMPLAVARPRSTADLALFVGRCAARGVALVPQGGLTGLVGAAVPRTDGREIAVSLDRMAAVRSVDTVGYTMVVEAGCILEVAKAAAADQDCLLPITFGAQGSCRVGANVATNAGGFNVLRYGMTRDLVLGLEVVLPDGRVWNGLRTLRKDNRGYDLKQLFIGSEGTLGIVTAVAFRLFPKPVRVETAWIGLPSVEAAMALYARARRNCSDLLSAFELILREGVEIALRVRPDLPDPFATPYPAYVLMELAASGPVDLGGLMEVALTDEAAPVADAVVASSKAQADRLWLIREAMVEHQGRGGRYLRTDVSVPIADIPVFIAQALAALARDCPTVQPVAYGHVGDGNVHLNVIPPVGTPPESLDRVFHEAEEVIFDVVDALGGSISAEHGIGLVKQAAFIERIDDVSLDLASRIKAMIDPHGMMSRGRLLPEQPMSARSAEP